MGTTYCPDGERALSDKAGNCTLYAGNTDPVCCSTIGGNCGIPPLNNTGAWGTYWAWGTYGAWGANGVGEGYAAWGTNGVGDGYGAANGTGVGYGAWAGATNGGACCTNSGACCTYCGGRCMIGGAALGVDTKYGVPATKLVPPSDRAPYC